MEKVGRTGTLVSEHGRASVTEKAGGTVGGTAPVHLPRGVAPSSPGRGGPAGGPSGRGRGTDPLERHFEWISEMLHATAGIRLAPSKRELVRSRLIRRIRQLGGGSVDAYIAFVRSPGGREELAELVDVLTTNKTAFFRERPHFDFLTGILKERRASPGGLTIWSAGCSSGEEPYTIAMVLAEYGAAVKPVRVLATDLSRRALDRARSAVYDMEQVAPIPASMRQRYTIPAGEPGKVRICDELRGMVRFARLNLMDRWPMQGPFDVIFCRNVMIYFDAQTRERLVNRFSELLSPGGYLFVGHSESLSALSHPLAYVQPATYRR